MASLERLFDLKVKDIIQVLIDSPVSAVVIVGQICFMGLAAVCQMDEHLRTSPMRQLRLGLIGLVLFGIGIAIALMVDR